VKDAVVVITGASAGLGRATAREFGRHGAKVGLIARGIDGLEAAKREIASSVLIAAVPGLIDYFSIDEAEMKRIGSLHLAANLGAVVIFAINLWLRFRLPTESNVPLALSILGVLAIGLGGWLGGEMVYVKGMAVEAVEKLAKKVEEPPRRRVA
jgi:NAD(P)-dependent dehydrogenase (short-subunit alcohol dehydrogenase family)